MGAGMNAITTGYLVEIPGLAEAVARSTPAPTHQLLDGMRAFEALAGVQLGAQRGDAYLVQCKVPDSQGRIVVPPPLREYAGLTRECVVIGADTRLEIWDAVAWDQYLAGAESAFSSTGSAGATGPAASAGAEAPSA